MMDPKLLKALSDAMITEIELKRQIGILKSAVEYYASANCWKAKMALQAIGEIKFKAIHSGTFPPVDQL